MIKKGERICPAGECPQFIKLASKTSVILLVMLVLLGSDMMGLWKLFDLQSDVVATKTQVEMHLKIHAYDFNSQFHQRELKKGNKEDGVTVIYSTPDQNFIKLYSAHSF